MIEFIIWAFMLLLGLSVHFLKELARISKEAGQVPKVKSYWTEHPYQTLLSVASAVAGFFFMYESGQLTAMTAFGVGYMADSAADVIGKRTASKMQ